MNSTKPHAPTTGSTVASKSSSDTTRAIDLFATPCSWDELARDDRPVELEIGSGKGLFLQLAAEENPEHRFIGIEVAAKFANRAASRLSKRGLSQVVVCRGDGQRFLQEVVPDQACCKVHVYFPDPWWRNKHKKRRVLNPQTIADIERVLQPEGEFHFWTDVLDYYEHICAAVMDTTRLIGPRYVPERVAKHHMDYTTHFERRARTHGQPVYRALFVKPAMAPSETQGPVE